MNNARIAINIKKYRDKKDLSRSDLAARSGVLASTIESIEAKRIANPDAATVQKIAKGLGVRAEDLLR
jgi:transcriptional regulator with XRE-family HTH domain